MLTTDLHYDRALLNHIHGEACLHDDVDVKEALNIILQKIVGTPTACALVLKDFANFMKIEVLFLTSPNEGLKLAPI